MKKKRIKKNSKVTSNLEKEFLVINKYPKDYKLFDIRANKPLCYIDSLEPSNDASMVLQEIDTINFAVKINGQKNTLDYFAPNNVSLLLSISNKALLSAQKIFGEYINPDKVNHIDVPDNKDRKEVIYEKSKIIYDYIEQIQTCIVFGYTALETFANLSINKDYKYKIDANAKGIMEIYDKEAIERWITLKIKISEILVDIYKTKDIKGVKLWNKFIQFEELRNEIIHQKAITSTNFYKTYFKLDVFNLCTIPEELIRFFFEERKNKKITDPLWPWIINYSNDFPISHEFKSENFEIVGNMYEGRTK